MRKDAKKNNSISFLIVLSTLIMIVSLIGATFAYFTATMDGNMSKVTLESAKLSSAKAEGIAVSLTVLPDDMLEGNGKNDYSSYKEADKYGSLNIEANTTETDYKVDCTYDIIYRPIIAYNKSKENNLNLKEFTIYGQQEIIVGADYTFISGEMSEFNLTDVKNQVTLVKGAKLILTGYSKTAKVSWKFKPRYYNLAINQDDNANLEFGGSIEVGSLVCVS